MSLGEFIESSRLIIQSLYIRWRLLLALYHKELGGSFSPTATTAPAQMPAPQPEKPVGAGVGTLGKYSIRGACGSTPFTGIFGFLSGELRCRLDGVRGTPVVGSGMAVEVPVRDGEPPGDLALPRSPDGMEMQVRRRTIWQSLVYPGPYHAREVTRRFLDGLTSMPARGVRQPRAFWVMNGVEGERPERGPPVTASIDIGAGVALLGPRRGRIFAGGPW